MSSNDTEEEFDQHIKQQLDDGWSIAERDAESVTLKKRGVGSLKIHVLLLVFTAWWTLAIPNVAYAAYRYLRGTSKTVHRSDVIDAAESAGAAGQPTAGASGVSPENPVEDSSTETRVADSSEAGSGIRYRLQALFRGRTGAYLAGGVLGSALYERYEDSDASPPKALFVGLAAIQAAILVLWLVFDVSLVRIGAGAAGFLLLVAGAQLYLLALGLIGFGAGFVFGQAAGDLVLALSLGIFGGIALIAVYRFLVVFPGLLAGAAGGAAFAEALFQGELPLLVFGLVGAVLGASIIWAIHQFFIAVLTAFLGSLTLYAVLQPGWFQTTIGAWSSLIVSVSATGKLVVLVGTVFGVLAQFGLVSRFPGLALPGSPVKDDENTGATDQNPTSSS